MSSKEKIMHSLISSLDHLEASISALKKDDMTGFDHSLWYAAEELEYALFLFMIRSKDEVDTSEWKPKTARGKDDLGRLLTKARELLNESQRLLVDEKWVEAYRKAYIARHYLVWVQERLAKKKLDRFKKK